MKRNGSRTSTPAEANISTVAEAKNNGSSLATAEPTAAELSAILAKLQRMRDGDFSVRLPGSWTGLSAKSLTRSMTSSPPISRWRRNCNA